MDKLTTFQVDIRPLFITRQVRRVLPEPSQSICRIRFQSSLVPEAHWC